MTALGTHLIDLVRYRTLPSGKLAKKLIYQDEEIKDLALAFIRNRDISRKYMVYVIIGICMTIGAVTDTVAEGIYLPWGATSNVCALVAFFGWRALAMRAARLHRALLDEIAACYTEVLLGMLKRGYSKKQLMIWDRSPLED